MTFSAITNFVVGDDPGMARWLLEHYFEHLNLNQAVQALGYNLPDYPLQQIGEQRAWLAGHQQIHQAIWTAIGGSNAADLSELDWENDSMVQNWLELHAAIHESVRKTLGI